MERSLGPLAAFSRIRSVGRERPGDGGAGWAGREGGREDGGLPPRSPASRLRARVLHASRLGRGARKCRDVVPARAVLNAWGSVAQEAGGRGRCRRRCDGGLHKALSAPSLRCVFKTRLKSRSWAALCRGLVLCHEAADQKGWGGPSGPQEQGRDLCEVWQASRSHREPRAVPMPSGAWKRLSEAGGRQRSAPVPGSVVNSSTESIASRSTRMNSHSHPQVFPSHCLFITLMRENSVFN